MLGLISPIGRPTSVGIRFNTFSAAEVKRRIRRSRSSMTKTTSTDSIKLVRSLFTLANSALRFCSSSLTVISSSLVACSSSFAVSSSSLVLCSSSLLERISSLADCSSSLVASCSSMMERRSFCVPANSPRRAASSRSAPELGLALSLALRGALCGDGARRGVEQHQVVGVSAGVGGGFIDDRGYFQSHLYRAGIASYPHAGLANWTSRFLGLMDGGPQIDGQSLPRHLEQIEGRVARRLLQKWSRAAAELKNVKRRIDQNSGRRITRQNDTVGFPAQVHVGL